METRGRPDVEDRTSLTRHHLLHRPGGEVDDRFDVHPHLRDLVGDRRLSHRPMVPMPALFTRISTVSPR